MIESVLGKALKVWLDGGFTMIPLFLTAMLMYGTAMELLLYFRRRNYAKVPEAVWDKWIEQPDKGEGEIGEIIRYSQDEVASLEDIRNRFAEIHAAKIPRINRRLVFLHILVLVSPLMGLLGTVLGMIKTFEAISLGSGKIVDMVSSGIAEALITTETGLLIALPGFFLAYIIRGKRNEYEAFLAHIESATMQHFQRTFR